MNRLCWPDVFEVVFTGALIFVPAAQSVFATAALPWDAILFVVPFPFIVWGADELRRFHLRRRRDEIVRERSGRSG